MKRMLALALLAASALAAHAHARLQSSSPADGASVAPAPAQLRLRFDEPLELAMSSVTLLGPDTSAVATAKPVADPADAKGLVLALPPLAPGAYRAQWSVMGRDGHRTKGEIRFSVK